MAGARAGLIVSVQGLSEVPWLEEAAKRQHRRRKH
jgi:hypothetical protein